jgi:hypothetical protein
MATRASTKTGERGAKDDSRRTAVLTDVTLMTLA